MVDSEGPVRARPNRDKCVRDAGDPSASALLKRRYCLATLDVDWSRELLSFGKVTQIQHS